MIRILAVSPITWDSTSFYRSRGPFNMLRKQMDIDIHDYRPQINNYTWAEIGSYDIIFFQRPAKAENFMLAEYAKEMGIKVWVDYDDDLFRLPNESRAWFEYTHPDVRKTMLKMLIIADVVTVSTLELKNFFDDMTQTTKSDVIPNALNDDWIVPAKEYNEDSKVVVWRGSETHCGDVTYFTGQLDEAISASTDEWHFMGYNPFTLTNLPELNTKIKCHKGEDIRLYNRNLMSLKPRMMHVPLVDNALNRAKSNIAWIEATYVGAVTVAPNWEEWQRPGVICYDSPDDYKRLLMEHSRDYAKCWRESMDYINKNLLLSHVNQKRKDIIEKLMGINRPVLIEVKQDQI